MFIELGVLFAALIHLLLINKEKLFGTIPKNIFWVGILIGFFVSLGDLGTNLGIATVGVPLTMAIMGGRPAVGAIAGYFIFKEKLNIRQILALFTIMIGVIGVSLYK
jgi:drug/metabolite transporter (DMT)-like permease